MMKFSLQQHLQLMLVLFSSAAIAETETDAGTESDKKEEPVPSVWNNWLNDPEKIPAELKDYLNQPLNKPIEHAEDNPDGKLCYALRQKQQKAEIGSGEKPRFCDYGPDIDEWERCCTTTHDVNIKNYNLEGLWPAECEREEYDGLKELSCLVCHPEQPNWTYYDAKKDIKIVRICKSLLAKFYNNRDLSSWKTSDYAELKLDEPTMKYSQCGGWQEPDPVLEAQFDEDGKFNGVFLQT